MFFEVKGADKILRDIAYFNPIICSTTSTLKYKWGEGEAPIVPTGTMVQLMALYAVKKMELQKESGVIYHRIKLLSYEFLL